MKKLLQINTVVNSGSTGRIAEEIGALTIVNGWESYIAYGRNPRESQSELIKIGSDFDLYSHVLKTRLTDRHGFGSKMATSKLIREIEIIKPNIIHLHNLHGYYVNIQLLFEYLSLTNIPVVWTLHDCWAFTGHCPYFDYIACSKWKEQCYTCPQKKSYPASLYIDSSRKNYNQKKELFNSVPNLTLITVSRWLNDLLGESFLGGCRSQIIYNGINTDSFSPQDGGDMRRKYNLVGKSVILGVANTWTQRKGFRDFIALSDLLSKEYQIVMVGLDKQQINSLPSNITGIQQTENIDELRQLYSLADIFFNPTWEDNFPTTNLEALSCGTPVLTYNTGGSIEAITPHTGFIVEKGDLHGAYDIIRKGKETWENVYSTNCRKRAVEFFNKDLQFNEYLQLYESLLLK